MFTAGGGYWGGLGGLGINGWACGIVVVYIALSVLVLEGAGWTGTGGGGGGAWGGGGMRATCGETGGAGMTWANFLSGDTPSGTSIL